MVSFTISTVILYIVITNTFHKQLLDDAPIYTFLEILAKYVNEHFIWL